MSTDANRNFPRLVKSVPDPLGLYLRPGHNDHRALLNLYATGDRSFTGAVFDPTKHDRHAELLEQTLKHNLDAILDPRTIQSALPGGYTDSLGNLAWGKSRAHRPADFSGISGRSLIDSLSSYCCDNGYTQVMAPTHYIASIDDAWFEVDLDSTTRLRIALDASGGSSTPLIYPLVIPYKLFRDREARIAIIRLLQQLPIDGIWLRIDGVGRNSTPTAALNYVEAARDFHSLQVPVVADHMGGAIGLSLMAFGSVGGITHGFMQNEEFRAYNLKRPRATKNFGVPRRVYLPGIDTMLLEKDFETLMKSNRAKVHFGCNDTSCCPRGFRDMIDNPQRHFLCQRMRQVSDLSRIPETIRPQRYMDQYLRPATDKALAATKVNWNNDQTEKKMLTNRKHLDTLRIALGDYAERNPPRSFSLHPRTRIARSARR